MKIAGDRRGGRAAPARGPGEIEAFYPDPLRARRLDARMRERLVASVRHVEERVARALPIPRDKLANGLGRIAAGPVSPLVFGAYFDLVRAIDAGDFVLVRRCLLEVAAASNQHHSPRVVALTPAAPHAPASRYRRLFDTDPANPVALAPPTRTDARVCRLRIHRALRTLDQACPALAGEIRSLLRVIVLARPQRGRRVPAFDGASSFMLWGAIVLNCDANRAGCDMVQALAHEAGHNFLFGMCVDGPLVRNDDAERYRSPLRTDLRPIDGIYHATFVIARMHLALKSLLDAGVLDARGRALARARLTHHERNFGDGMSILRQHGRLTALGRRVMSGAVRYMESARHRPGTARRPQGTARTRTPAGRPPP